MFRKLTVISVCRAMACLLTLTITIPAFAQDTQNFQYVIPRFSSNAGSEVLISNLSSLPASPEVVFFDSIQGKVGDTFLTIAAGAQQRLTAGSFSLNSFDGTAVVTSTTPLSVMATLAAGGGLEGVSPSTSSDDLIVPFSQGTTGDMRVTIFNPENRQTNVVIVPVLMNGSALGSAQVAVPALGAIAADIAGLFPQTAGSPHDISHLMIRIPTTILGSQHHVFAQAEMFNFSDPAEGIAMPHADFSEVTAVPAGAGGLGGTFPFFVQGGDYVTELQFINVGSNAATVTATALGFDGNAVPGTAATSVVVPANGAVRHSVRTIFNLGEGTILGSVVFQSTAPVIAAEAIASVSQSGFVVLPVGPQPNTNFVFSVPDSNLQSFLGLALLNPSTSTANLTVQEISDAGAAISSTTLTLNPSAEASRTLADLLPNGGNAGFIYITSDVPIIATALQGAIDNSMLDTLPDMHSQPSYGGPTSIAALTPPTQPSGFGSAAPVLTSLGALPVPLIAGNSGFTTTISGTGFLSGVSGLINGVPVPTTLVSPTIIQVTIPPEDLAVGTILKISVLNPAPTVAPSNALPLPVLNPVPVVLTISPDNASVELEPNMPPLSITVSGFGFKQAAMINVNGVSIPTTFQSGTSLVGSIPESLLGIGGAYPVSVVNPDPSAGPSNALPLLLSNLQPLLTAVETDQLLTFDSNRPNEQYTAPIVVRGSNFSTASVFEFSNLCSVPGLAVSPTTATVLTSTTQQFTAYLNGKATSAVTWSVNGIPGGNTTVGMISAAGLYMAPPTLPSPTTVTVTATASSTFAAATVAITAATSATGGVTGAGALGATVVSSHEANLTVTIQCVGQYSIRVRNPQPGGGISQTLSFNVVPLNPVSAPSITSLSVGSITAGSPSFTLAISGSNFATGAVVNFGSAVLFPTAVTSTAITVTVPWYLITQGGPIPVVVTNPDSGGSSNRVLFTVK